MDDTGYHYILDLKLKCNDILTSGEKLRELFESALSGFTILKYAEHKFETEGAGVTGFFLLSESHLSFHSYPENNYIAVDIFTCGRDPKASVGDLLKKLDCLGQTIRHVTRGSSVIAKAPTPEKKLTAVL
jgi:S-adenosylmethionine decarboxylase